MSAIAGSTALSSAALALDDLVDEPDPLRPQGIEPAAAGEQGTGVRFADLRDDERRDDGGEDAEPRLGEPESRARLGDHEVAHRAEAHPAPERRALDSRDDGHGARVDGLEHLGHRHRVLLVALDVERHRGAHPVDVRAGTERLAFAGEDHGAQLRRRISLECRERRPKLGDQRGIERVPDRRAARA